jgi:hypothetical protein
MKRAIESSGMKPEFWKLKATTSIGNKGIDQPTQFG